MKIDIQNTTNLFESKTGALNLAPVKISGQYKIIVALDGNLYFDDYNGKQVIINKNQKFLPQLANFLRTPSLIQDYSKLKYGAFSNKKILSYHAPFYIGQKYEDQECTPDYFVVNNIGYGNNTDTNNIDDDTKLGNISKNIKIVNLKNVGLQNIFDEITNNQFFQFPFYSNFENGTITIYGFDYIKTTSTKKEFSLLDSFANQTNFESVNNKILNLFNENNIIFPKFLNIEFQFEDDYSKVKNLFGNYYGFYSYENNINKDSFNSLKSSNKYGIFSREFIDNNLLVQKQVNNNTIDKLLISLFNVYSLDTKNDIPFLRLKFNYLTQNDIIKFYNEDDTVFFEYKIKTENIKESFREILVSVANSITKESEKQINCYLDQNLLNTLNFDIQSDITNIYVKKPEQLNQYEFVDIFNSVSDKLYFKSIEDDCIIINNIFDTQNAESKQGKYIKLEDDIFYKIKEYFIYKGNLVCKVFDENYQMMKYRYDNILITIYDEIDSKLFYHNPINFLSFISDDIIVKSNQQFDKEKYLVELDNKFNTSEFQTALDSFKTFKTVDSLPYLNYEYDATTIVQNNYPNINKDVILNMKFNSIGFTSFFNPNFFNFDLRFYDNNSNVVLENLDYDRIRFHWFLIKSEAPEYIKSTNYGLSQHRYFTDKPQITSRLVDTGTFCETIFLGVKYHLPRKYKNYQFAVYLDYNNYDIYNEDTDLVDNHYEYVIDSVNKTIYLKLNKYLDFVDLIRDGNKNTDPFLDLSFFYTVRKSYNSKSDLVMTFKSGGLLMCDDKIPTFFNGQIIKDWKTQINGEWYICLKRSNLVNTAPLSDLIQGSGDVKFFVYSKHKKIRYLTMEYLVKDVQYVSADYVWCKDVHIKFFDNKNLLINEYNSTTDENILHKFSTSNEPEDDTYLLITEDDIQPINHIDNNYLNEKATLTVQVGNDNKVFSIFNTKNTFSLKENYIHTSKNVRYLINGSMIIDTETFKFPEYNQDENKWYQLIADDFDNNSENQLISIFNRNQIWFIIKSLMQTELKFKNSTEAQTIKLINELLLANLQEYSTLKNIAIKDSNEYIKMSVLKNDYNAVIWKIQDIDNTIKDKVVKVARYSGPYYPHFDEIKNLSEFQTYKHNNNQLLNIFDKNYGNIFKDEQKLNLLGYTIKQQKELVFANVISSIITYDINSLGLWNELQGNIISSLFIKQDDIVIDLKYSSSNIITINELFNTKNEFTTINQNLFDQLTFNDLFKDRNVKYISEFNNNINEYIYDKGIDWLLSNHYELSSIIDLDNKKIKFSIDNNQIIINESNYQPNGTYKFNFTRK